VTTAFVALPGVLAADLLVGDGLRRRDRLQAGELLVRRLRRRHRRAPGRRADLTLSPLLDSDRVGR
jgi:hypothetical protein